MAQKKQNSSEVEAARILSRRNLIGVIIGAVIAAIATFGVTIYRQDPKITPPETVTFSGRVYNRKNPTEKITNAVVVIEGEGVPPLVTTDSEGIFTFPLKDPKREYRLRIEVEGFEPYNLRVVPSDRKDIQPIPLIPSPLRPPINTSSNQGESAPINPNAKSAADYDLQIRNPPTVIAPRLESGVEQNQPVSASPSPAPLMIKSLQSTFYSGNEGKDKYNSISETYSVGNKILVQNDFWGSGMVYREKSIHQGQEFPVDIPWEDCSKLRYAYRTNNTGGWDVGFEIKAKLSDGSTKVIARSGTLSVGKGRPETGTIALCGSGNPAT
ncbi:MAG TPA: carboxypeptidase-like regulatory domain-containing protein [Pyrinomonadaceae bacterium]|jgi:hypothetical protein